MSQDFRLQVFFPESLSGSFQIFSKNLGDIRKSRCTTGINDTCGKFATSINNNSGIGIKICRRCRWHLFQICHRCRWYQWCTLTCEYLREFSKKNEITLELFIGWGKNSWHCPFDKYENLYEIWGCYVWFGKPRALLPPETDLFSLCLQWRWLSLHVLNFIREIQLLHFRPRESVTSRNAGLNTLPITPQTGNASLNIWHELEEDETLDSRKSMETSLEEGSKIKNRGHFMDGDKGNYMSWVHGWCFTVY